LLGCDVIDILDVELVRARGVVGPIGGEGNNQFVSYGGGLTYAAIEILGSQKIQAV
jgi:hypothetical protein